MDIQTRKEKDVTVVSVKGRLDAVSSPEFEKALAGQMSQGETAFVLDFGALDYISSAGLRSILAFSKKLKEKQGKLFLLNLKDVVKEVFDISGFTTILPIFNSFDEALSQK
jgi:anti-anti-sigma factor